MEDLSESKFALIGASCGVIGLLFSAVALVFTYRQMTLPFQQQLYAKQIDVILDLNAKAADLQRVGFSILADDPTLGGLKVLSVKEAVDAYDDAMRSAGAVLPTAVYQRATIINGAARDLIKDFLDCNNPEKHAFKLLNAVGEWSIHARSYLGAEDLSSKTAILYGQQPSLDLRSVEIDADSDFGRFYLEATGSDEKK